MKRIFYCILAILFSLMITNTGCNKINANDRTDETCINETVNMKTKTIYLAGGCFWGTEHFFKQVPGVVSTEVGYANSNVPNPSYKQVCSGMTGAAETVKIEYNPDSVSLPFLLDLYFKTIDPTSLNRQGNDYGTQYRTGIYYTDSADKSVVNKSLSILQDRIGKPIAIESGELKNFYPAEDYHQEYLTNNPDGYCHINPALFAYARNARDTILLNEKNKRSIKTYAKPDTSELRSRLSPLQFEVTQHGATERPFANEYNAEFRKGIYVDITNGEPLFVSTDKFESGCGWPAFSRPISDDLLVNLPDNSHGMRRVEVRGKSSGAHLGHVFEDGPVQAGGLRYCINSASLRFIPLEKMESEGYGAYIPLVK